MTIRAVLILMYGSPGPTGGCQIPKSAICVVARSPRGTGTASTTTGDTSVDIRRYLGTPETLGTHPACQNLSAPYYVTVVLMIITTTARDASCTVKGEISKCPPGAKSDVSDLTTTRSTLSMDTGDTRGLSGENQLKTIDISEHTIAASSSGDSTTHRSTTSADTVNTGGWYQRSKQGVRDHGDDGYSWVATKSDCAVSSAKY